MKTALILFPALFFLNNCSENTSVTAEKDVRMTYFAFENLNPPAIGIIDESRKTITVETPLGTNLKNLKPAIEHSEGAQITVWGEPENFELPVIYKIENQGKTAIYTIFVNETVFDAKMLKVGNDKEFKTISAAAAAATDNCIVEIDAGVYRGDVAKWTQNNIIIRSSGGKVIVDAAGKHTGGVGIWEIDGGAFLIEGITFKNAEVPDENGAGIRLTKGNVTVKNCRFLHSQNGLLTSNDGASKLTIKNCEFGYNGSGDGYTHNLYVGRIAEFAVFGSWFHHVNNGHLLKTRAALSIIKYNMLADGGDNEAKASYELDFASGGRAIVVGNIIQQSENTQNPIIISYANENDRPYADNELHVCHNTIINSRHQKALIINAPKDFPIFIGACNNLLSKNSYFDTELIDREEENIWFEATELTGDYAPALSSVQMWKNKIIPDPDKYLSPKLKAQRISLVPRFEYIHPLSVKPLDKLPTLPGAKQ